MIKGINRQVIVVKSPDPRLFEEAIFLLREDALEGIVRKYLNQLQQRAAVAGIQIGFPEELVREVACSGKQQGGARQIRRLVQERVEGPLAVYLLQCGRKPGKIKVKMDEGKLTFHS